MGSTPHAPQKHRIIRGVGFYAPLKALGLPQSNTPQTPAANTNRSIAQWAAAGKKATQPKPVLAIPLPRLENEHKPTMVALHAQNPQTLPSAQYGEGASQQTAVAPHRPLHKPRPWRKVARHMQLRM